MATTIPGGYYLGTDRQAHNANGERIAARIAVESAAGTPVDAPMKATGPIGPVPAGPEPEAEPAAPRKAKRG